MTPTRLANIDLVKVIAMLMVLLLHVGVIRGLSLICCQVPEIYLLAGIAIPLFFMVSGYLLSSKNVSIEYCSRKIWGIIRFVLIVCILYGVLRLLMGRLDFLSAISAIVNNFLKGFIQRGEFGVFWYFGAMLIIYTLLPVLHYVINSRYLQYVIVALWLISTLMCFLDVRFRFEKQYIPQTFRLWYWLLYFLLGATINKHPKSFHWIRWRHVFLAGLGFIFFGYYVHAGGNEYLFGSLPCMLYAMMTFCACINTRINNTRVIDELSSLFLPVYAFHMIGLIFLYKHWPMPQIEDFFCPHIAITIEYIIATGVIVFVCWLIMRIPYANKVFRI